MQQIKANSGDSIGEYRKKYLPFSWEGIKRKNPVKVEVLKLIFLAIHDFIFPRKLTLVYF